MASPDLHKFADDLKRKPAGASNAPPRSIAAADLDGNFTKVTVVDDPGLPQLYKVRYTPAGTILEPNVIDFDVCENGEAVQYQLVGRKKRPAADA